MYKIHNVPIQQLDPLKDWAQEYGSQNLKAMLDLRLINV